MATRINCGRHGLCLGHSLLLDQKLQGAIAAAAGRDLEHPGLLALTVENGPHIQALQQRPLGNALSELLEDTPPLIRRTLDWLSTSLLKGMSREGDSVIF